MQILQFATPLCGGLQWMNIYVVHRLQSISRTTIHLSDHIHVIANRKCRKSIKETKILIERVVIHTLDAKISTISLSANKSFFYKHFFNDSNDGTIELLHGEGLEHIQDKFIELNSSNIHNLVASFKHHLEGGYIDHIF
jgi:hypothetical protein